MAKTITDIIPPSRRRAIEGTSFPSQPLSSEPRPAYQPPMPPRPLRDGPIKSRGRFPYGTALVALVLIVGSLAVLASFANAKVIIVPNTSTATLNDDFTATFGSGDLPYETVTVTSSISATVPAESSETVNDPAQGNITIYNAQSVAQALIKNTRFESADGHIFRIHDSVTVPAGSAAAPGTVTTIAYADAGGEDYNIPATSFTLPGLQGTNAYTLVTAKSTDAMQGGFSGTRPSVSQATQDTQNQKSQAALLASLVAEAKTKLPAGYDIIPGGTFPTYTPQADTSPKDGQVNVNLQGTLVAVAFPDAALAKAIATKIAGSYGGQTVHLADPNALTLTPADPTTVPTNQPTFDFKLSGNVSILWDIDQQKIAAAVAGKTRDSANLILVSFPEVAEATLQIQPFWKQTFPADPKNITVSTTTASAAK